MGTHSAFGEGSHTGAYTPKQWPSRPRPQCGSVPPAKFLLFRHALYTYISRFSVNPHYQQREKKIQRNCRHKFYPQTAFHCVFQLLAQMVHVRFHSRKRVHTRFSEKDRAQALTRRNTGRFGWGRYCYPRTVSRVLEPLRGQGVKRRTLPLLGLGRVCFRRTQKAFGTAMRSCASLF